MSLEGKLTQNCRFVHLCSAVSAFLKDHVYFLLLPLEILQFKCFALVLRFNKQPTGVSRPRSVPTFVVLRKAGSSANQLREILYSPSMVPLAGCMSTNRPPQSQLTARKSYRIQISLWQRSCVSHLPPLSAVTVPV